MCKHRQKINKITWGHTRSQKKSQTFSARKIILNTFWNRRGVLLMNFKECGTTIISGVYGETLEKLKGLLKNKLYDMFNSGVVFLHNSASLHTARCTWAFWQQFSGKWFITLHLAPNNYHFFMHMKKLVASRHFDDDELQSSVQSQVTEFYDDGIQMLVKHCERCLSLDRDCVE